LRKETRIVNPQRKPNPSKIAVGYCRCSTDEQGATSIPQQKEEIERWAAADDFTIAEWFIDEGKSGTSFLSRPGFSELVRRVEANPDFGFVLVYDESRWGRALNPRENAYWKVHFERHGVKVRVIHSNSKNGDDIGSYVVEVVESAEASEYSKKLSRAIMRGMLSSQQGIYSRGGTAPYGYKRIAIDLTTGERRELRDGMRSAPRQEKVVWELGKKEEVDTVQKIFDLRVQGLGFVAIADILNTEGVPCPKRGRWRNKDQKWSGVTVNGIIANLSYTGMRVYNRLSFSQILAKEKGYILGSKKENDKDEWIIVKNAHPAIVSKELFDRANSFRGKHDRSHNQHYFRSEYLLTGLVKCAQCNFNYQGFHHKKTGNSYYVDGGYINKGKSVCNWFSVRKDLLEDFVLRSVREVLGSPRIIEKTKSRIQDLINKQPLQIQRRIQSITQLLKENEGKIENLMRLAEEGGNLKTVAARLRELEEIQQKLKEEKTRLQNHQAPKGREANILGEVTSFFQNFESQILTATVAERKEILRRAVDAIIVDREQMKARCYVRILPKFPFLKDFSQPTSSILGAKVALTGIEPVFQP
jgi:site-specific DNA recombinase